MLTVRCLSLTVHLVTLRSLALARLTTVVAVCWSSGWITHRAAPEALPAPLRTAISAADRGLLDPLVRGVLAPEQVRLAPLLALLCGAAVGGGLLTIPAARFVEPAAEAAYAGEQLRVALSERGAGRAAAAAVRTGIPSWQRWPASPYAAIAVRGWCHLRRRRREDTGAALVLLCVSLAAMLFDPRATLVPLAFALVARSLAAPTDTLAQDLSHQHVWLSALDPLKSAGAAALPGATATALVLLGPAVPAVAATGPSLWAVLAALTGVLCAATTVVTAGAVAAVIAEHVVVRAAASLVLAVAPVAIAVLAPLGYRTWQTSGVLAGTLAACCLVATVLYGSIVTTHLRSTPGT